MHWNVGQVLGAHSYLWMKNYLTNTHSRHKSLPILCWLVCPASLSPGWKGWWWTMCECTCLCWLARFWLDFVRRLTCLHFSTSINLPNQKGFTLRPALILGTYDFPQQLSVSIERSVLCLEAGNCRLLYIRREDWVVQLFHDESFY